MLFELDPDKWSGRSAFILFNSGTVNARTGSCARFNTEASLPMQPLTSLFSVDIVNHAENVIALPFVLLQPLQLSSRKRSGITKSNSKEAMEIVRDPLMTGIRVVGKQGDDKFSLTGTVCQLSLFPVMLTYYGNNHSINSEGQFVTTVYPPAGPDKISKGITLRYTYSSLSVKNYIPKADSATR